jgi:hypothetical protein
MIFRKFLNLVNGKVSMSYIWDMLLFIRVTFSDSEDISIPSDKVLIMASPVFDGELSIDGEAHII